MPHQEEGCATNGFTPPHILIAIVNASILLLLISHVTIISSLEGWRVTVPTDSVPLGLSILRW